MKEPKPTHHVLVTRGNQRQMVLNTEVERYEKEGWTAVD